MNEQERADSLARAIDELIRGAKRLEAAQVDEELRSLVDVATARMQASLDSGRRAADHESVTWKRLTDRMESREKSDRDGPDEHLDDDMGDVVAARRRVSEDILELAEQHREEVWRRVQEKVANRRPKKRGIFSFLESVFRDPELANLLNQEAAEDRPHFRRSTAGQHLLRIRIRLDPGHQHHLV